MKIVLSLGWPLFIFLFLKFQKRKKEYIKYSFYYKAFTLAANLDFFLYFEFLFKIPLVTALSNSF